MVNKYHFLGSLEVHKLGKEGHKTNEKNAEDDKVYGPVLQVQRREPDKFL